MKARALIVGMGSTGTQLARRLASRWDLSLIDIDAQALASSLLPEGAEHHCGDATSALVLKRAGAGSALAVVACTGLDEVNLEVLRVARESFAVERLHAALQSPDWEGRYREAGVDAVDVHQATAALLEARLEHRAVASGIGLGEGEIQEITVLPSSSAIGRPLRELHPRSWLVGAVYRGGRLVVPHGDTVIEKGDRLVLIGDPGILSSIASHLRSGEPEFPLHYGPSLVVLGNGALAPRTEELRYLCQATAVRGLEILLRKGEEPDPDLIRQLEEGAVSLVRVPGKAADPLALAREAVSRDAGIFVLPDLELPLSCRLGLRRSVTVKMLDHLTAPVLIPRGTFPYARTLLALADLPFPDEAAQLAIDLVRMVRGELYLGVVHQPDMVVGNEHRRRVEAEQGRIEALAKTYQLPLKVETMAGNPISEVLRRCPDFNLLVLPYQRRRRATLARPDIGQHLLHRACCSTLVLPC